MNRIVCIFILSMIGCSSRENSHLESRKVPNAVIKDTADTYVDFNSFNTRIRDGLISKDSALIMIKVLLPQLKNCFRRKGGQKFDRGNWVFPLQGYNYKAIGGINGNGYSAAGYDYFSGNKHGGHPAYDIFIRDSNHNCMDIATKKRVNVLSASGGIVVSVENSWDSNSTLRGGKYIWIYDPYSSSMLYYAHNSDIFVRSGDIVIPGTKIATVGRSGFSAFKKRSPTHLHFMVMNIDSQFYPRPVKFYKELMEMRSLK